MNNALVGQVSGVTVPFWAVILVALVVLALLGLLLRVVLRMRRMRSEKEARDEELQREVAFWVDQADSLVLQRDRLEEIGAGLKATIRGNAWRYRAELEVLVLIFQHGLAEVRIPDQVPISGHEDDLDLRRVFLSILQATQGNATVDPRAPSLASLFCHEEGEGRISCTCLGRAEERRQLTEFWSQDGKTVELLIPSVGLRVAVPIGEPK